MATMKRNINLEELDSDAMFGISFLNYQSMLQKIIFWSCVVIGAAWNILGAFVFHFNSIGVIFGTFIPLFIGIAFGCNYNEDLSLFNYFMLIFFKPKQVLMSKPTEDLAQLKAIAAKIKEEEDMKKKQELGATPEEQRKLLMELIFGGIAFVLFLIIVVIVILANKTDVMHHIIE